MIENYWQQFAEHLDRVYKSHRELADARIEYPWLTGALGDPGSGIFFVAENPSLFQIERYQEAHPGKLTSEVQWSGSRGDLLFRDMLVKHGFKTGSPLSPGGWKCYITNVIKQADYSKNWHEKSQNLRNQAAEIWSDILNWELSMGKPALVVIMGRQTEALVNHLSINQRIILPRTMFLTHYAYIGQRAQGKLGPMHPARIESYDREFNTIEAALSG